MKCKRPLLLFCALLFVACVIRAQDMQPCVVVEQTDGTTSNYLLSSDPQIRYDSQNVTLTSDDADLVLPAAEVSRIYLSQAPSDLSSVNKIEADVPQFRVTSSAISVTGVAPGVPVAVYAIDGRQLSRATASADGSLTIPLSSLPQGVLVVNAGKHSFKLIRK